VDQPFPRVFPAFDFAGLDDPLEARVFPAFDSALLLGFPALAFATTITSFALPFLSAKSDRIARCP